MHPQFSLRRRLSLAALALASLSVLACGGQSNGDAHGGGSGGGSTGGASGGNGSGNSGGRSGSGGRGGNASGGASTGGAACGAANFADDRGWSVSVVIANQTQQTLHLGQTMVTCGVSPLFQVEDAAGSPLPDLGDCRQPCERVVTGGGIGCPGICAFPEAVTLAPGEGTSMVWSGLFRTSESVPVRCLPAGLDNERVECDRARQIEPGRFRFIAQAGTSLDCSSTLGSCGVCVGNGTGGCKTSAALIAGTLLSAETTVDLGGGYGVGPDIGHEMPYPVEIFFKD